jgi:N-acyl-D-aspartate/D-glutamate deacylase
MFRNLVISSAADTSLIERRLFDVASERGVDPADLMFDLAGQDLRITMRATC